MRPKNPGYWLQYQSVSIYLPQTVTYLVSNDNFELDLVGQVNTQAVGNGNLSKQYCVTDLTNITARYVQVQVLRASASWTFIDEGQVLQ